MSSQNLNQSQVLAIKRIVNTVLSRPKSIISLACKAYKCFKHGGIRALKAKLHGKKALPNYDLWIKKYDSFAQQDLQLLSKACSELKYAPKISIITPVYNPTISDFLHCLDSIIAQAYQNWELCLADDCSSSQQIRNIIQDYASKDKRIKFTFRDKCGHISAASNSAIALATGEYLAFVDHDDQLSLDALYFIAAELNNFPETKIIYSDEDNINCDGLRFNPHFKSDWNLELLLHQNYICHLLVIKADLVRSVGSLRSEFDGAQDWDLILRVSEQTSATQIRHIPHILYHWSATKNSTATSILAKPYVLQAQAKAVQAHLDRTSQHSKAIVCECSSHIRIVRSLPEPAPTISVILVVENEIKLLRQSLESILSKISYRNFEIIILDNSKQNSSGQEYLQSLSKIKNIKIIQVGDCSGIAAINNLAIQAASGEMLLFFKPGLQVSNSNWLSVLVAQAIRVKTGAVGPKIIATNSSIQNAGIFLDPDSIATQSYKGLQEFMPGYFARAILSQNLSAISSDCLLIRKSIFEQVQGFDTRLSSVLKDVDLCLRIRLLGYNIVFEPEAELHISQQSKIDDSTLPKEEIDIIRQRWSNEIGMDPYYNPNLSNVSEEIALAFPPRIKRSWKN
jgi:glycosyltransferase involved in cell wall biosynthesis